MLRLFDRIALLVRADAHGVMDQLEEESLLLKQHLRDAELELNRKRARLDVMNEEERQLASALEELEPKESELETDVELALEGEDESLTRFAVRRLLVAQQARTQLAERRSRVVGERDELAEKFRAQESELEILRARVNTRLERVQRESATSEVLPSVAEQDIDLELLRRSRARRDATTGTANVSVGEGA